MADDLFDYTLQTSDFGKEVGADLREGKLTLPVIYALKQANSSDRDLMIKIIRNTDFTTDDFKTLLDLLVNYGGIDYTRETAASYIDTAKNALALFEPSPTKETMLDIADYALQRRV
jgi:octaprenyl-diphosphate synthase